MENVKQPDDPRAALVQRLTFMHDLLRWINERWQAKAVIAQRYQALMLLPKKWGFGRYALWVGILTAGMAFIGTIVFRAIGRAELEEQGRSSLVNMQPLTVAILAFPVALFLALGVLLLWNKVLLPKQGTRVQRINGQRKAHNETVWSEEHQVDAQLKQAGQNLAQHIGNSFPQAYLHEDAIVFCIHVVRNHRANDVTSALNLYETELHRQRVENTQAAQLAEAQRARKLQAVGNVMNAAATGAAIGAVRSEGRANRAASAANAARVTEQLKKPRTVHVKKRGGLW